MCGLQREREVREHYAAVPLAVVGGSAASVELAPADSSRVRLTIGLQSMTPVSGTLLVYISTSAVAGQGAIIAAVSVARPSVTVTLEDVGDLLLGTLYAHSTTDYLVGGVYLRQVR